MIKGERDELGINCDTQERTRKDRIYPGSRQDSLGEGKTLSQILLLSPKHRLEIDEKFWKNNNSHFSRTNYIHRIHSKHYVCCPLI